MSAPKPSIGGMQVAVIGPQGPAGPWVLPHGVDPKDFLAQAGWSDLTLRSAEASTSGPKGVCLWWSASATGTEPTSTLTPLAEAGAGAPQVQRVAAYAVICGSWQGEESILLTQLSERVAGLRADLWTLPGGRVEPGEDPAAATIREVWEETGHTARELEFVDVISDRRIFESSEGPVEDFHAIRLIYLAQTTPIEPVVHDIGGSTSLAAWVPLAQARTLGGTAGLIGSRRWWPAAR